MRDFRIFTVSLAAIWLVACVSAGREMYDNGLSLIEQGKEKDGLQLLKQSCEVEEYAEGCNEYGKRSGDLQYVKKACDISEYHTACVDYGAAMKAQDKNASVASYKRYCNAKHVIQPPPTLEERKMQLKAGIKKMQENSQQGGGGGLGALLSMFEKGAAKLMEKELRDLESDPDSYLKELPDRCDQYAEQLRVKEDACKEAGLDPEGEIVRNAPACSKNSLAH